MEFSLCFVLLNASVNDLDRRKEKGVIQFADSSKVLIIKINK